MVLAILQARTSSHRFPGKVLQPLQGRPMIVQALARIEQARRVDSLVLATSTDPSDDPLADAVAEAGYAVHRGPLGDVLTRFLQVIDAHDDETVVRLTGDNALSDPDLIDLVIDEYHASGADYTSNVLEPTYPHGLAVEVFAADTLRAVDPLATTEPEREHVTIGIYRRPERFALHSVTQEVDQSQLRWTIDYPEDLEFVRAVYAELFDTNPHFGKDAVLELLEKRPELVHRER